MTPEASGLAAQILIPKKQAYERSLEERARQILSAQLDSESYLLTVTSSIDEAKIQSALCALLIIRNFPRILYHVKSRGFPAI